MRADIRLVIRVSRCSLCFVFLSLSKPAEYYFRKPRVRQLSLSLSLARSLYLSLSLSLSLGASEAVTVPASSHSSPLAVGNARQSSASSRTSMVLSAISTGMCKRSNNTVSTPFLSCFPLQCIFCNVRVCKQALSTLKTNDVCNKYMRRSTKEHGIQICDYTTK